MTKRKKNILLIQILIFITAILLIYYTYGNKEKQDHDGRISKNFEKEKNDKEDESESNIFADVEYKGVDLQGNRYEIKSKEATFEIEKPELISKR